MKKIITSFLGLCLMALTTMLTAQNTVYVNTTGDDSNDGLTEITPVKTFAYAVSIANAGTNFTEIVLAPGTYEETVTAELSTANCPTLLIRGESAKTTIIQRTGTGRIINTLNGYLTSSNSLTIRDVTLRDANVTNLQGAAIYFSRTGNMTSNLTLERVIFENNTITSGTATSNGGAFFFNGNQLTVTDCYFKDNKVFKSGTNNPQGGAVTIATLASTDGLFATFTNTTFEGNEAYTSGGALFFNNVGARLETSPNSYVNFVNCTFLNNKATNTGTTGGAVNLTSGANAAYHLMDYKLVNCTFLNNSSEGTNSKNTLMLNGNRYNSATMVNNLIVPLSTASTGDVFGGNFATNERLIGSNNLIGGSINTTYITSSYFRTDSVANNNLIGWREDFFINSTLTDNSTATVFAVPYLELNSGSKAINFGVSSYGDPNIVPATDVRGIAAYGASKDIGAFEFNSPSTATTTLSGNDQIKLYPNPVQSVFYLDAKEIAKVDIFTLNGMKIQTIKNPQGGIDASGLTQGMYLIHIYTENGTFTKSFVKL
ncbi:MAG: T9SS type A sorting domain-containing protein [Paludibacter sp.]|nr:T9SS type A sorting domain-containing protein [Paludibacter sp.]